MRVATVCMNAKLDTAASRERMADYIRQAAERDADLIFFPECVLQQNPGWGRSTIRPRPTNWPTCPARQSPYWAIAPRGWRRE